MKKNIWVLWLVAVVSLLGCTDSALQIQAQTANSIAQAANTELPVLVAQFRQDGMNALQAVLQKNGTEEKARADLAIVETKWQPVWKSWAGLRAAHDLWATVLESGGDYLAALAGLKTAYCALLALWPQAVPAVPIAPVLCPKAEKKP